MISATTETIPGYNVVEVLGIARGNVVRARAIGKDIMANLRSVVGGEIHEYTQLVAQSREHSVDRMQENAAEMGANAVIGVRFTTSVMMNGSAELLAYGTAVKIEPVS
ncbi:MAG: YbjQ family protein [Gammaproteobacteria bacterium]|nr:YbjQ family protein [Gammaproteobacteria bacterium]